ncbi:MAG: glycosyltransferase family 1 protein [Mariprofundaceae bacterium]|nr:glycosyltransferase family 1 protein [Mariprofundaceae bacterium]
MKIAIDAYHAARPHGGIARYTRGLALAMFELAQSDEFILFSNRFRENVKEWNPHLPNVSSTTLHAPKRLMQAAWDYLSWPPIEKWTEDIDIYHGMHFVLPAVRAAKCVLTVHDLTYLKHPEFFVYSKLNQRGYLKELPAALKRADAVIAVSESTKHDLMTLMDYPEERIHVIYEGVEAHFFERVSSEQEQCILNQYKLNKPYMIFLVGTPEPRKNLERTIRAAQSVAPDMPIAVVGDPELVHALLRDALASVCVLGSVPDEDLSILLHAAELSLYPSLYEGFGLPILESMAAGVPVITSNISSCPEVAGDAALLVDPYDEKAMADAIQEILQHETKANDMRQAGEERASLFTWQRAAKDVLQLYRDLVQ